MFSQGASDPDRVDAIMYGHDYEDFTKGSIGLDEFVFDHVNNLFEQAKTNQTLYDELNRENIVFFLHLLGIDTAGHSYRPYSAEYYDNIKFIDRQIENLYHMVQDFYQHDQKTAWVFTADHGMSDWGSHGDGHPDNTRTPLIAWGAGVAAPDYNHKGHHDEFSKPWKLDSVKRNDVNQADIAPLMSYLVGLNYPANSVGEIPLAYLDASLKDKSISLRANVMEIIEQYLVKEHNVHANHWIFKPFRPLSEHGLTIANRLSSIDQHIERGQYDFAIEQSEELMKLSLQGLKYFQTYNWLFLRSLVTTGFIGWIVYATTSFLHIFIVDNTQNGNKRESFVSIPRLFGLFTLSCLLLLFYSQNSPFNYYLYAVFPVLFWTLILENVSTIKQGVELLIRRLPSKHPNSAAVTILIFGFFLMEAIVYGYFHREMFSFCFGIATMWPWIQNSKVALANYKLALSWAVLCLITGSFTLLPAVKQESINQIVTAGSLMVAAGLVCISNLNSSIKLTKLALISCGAQIGLLILTIVVTRSSVLSLQARSGLPLGNQVVGWFALILSLIIPVFSSFAKVSDYRFRLLTLFLAFGPTFIILTISYEGLFYVAFFALLMTWIEFEALFYAASPSGKLSLGEFRLSLFFFFLCQIGFFGTGNIASISSFSLDSVYRLIPVFNPFSMAVLLLFKILVPFAILSVSLGILNLRLGVPASALFFMGLSISDILTLNFFYLVVDEGSWLDIGTSISHYCIASLLCLFIIVLESLSTALVAGSTLPIDLAKKTD